MLQLTDTPLPGNALRWLRSWQSEIDALPDYATRVAEAKRQWSLKNKKSNKTFGIVKDTLTRMQGKLRRCAYCEDSLADEVEHIRPKDLYPESVFAWNNYLYVCGSCNVAKSNNYAVFTGNGILWEDVKRAVNAPMTPPIVGDPVLIDPRRENPMDFLILDLRTFQFEPLADSQTRDYARAEYTIQTLTLWREPLREARVNAASGFLARLIAYGKAKAEHHPVDELERHKYALLSSQNLTVWREMQRQFQISPRLALHFEATPEALDW